MNGVSACFSTSCVVLGVSAVLVGCQTPTAEQRQFRSELAKIDPHRDPLAVKTPIIDIHTHTFNARFLPLNGILLGKRDAFAPVTWLITDHCARTLAQAVVDRTPLASAPGMRGMARPMSGREKHDPRGVGFVCKIFLGLLNKAAEKGAWDESLSESRQMQMIDEVAEEMNFAERMAIRSAVHMMGMEDHLDAPDKKSALEHAVRFLWLLTQSDAELPDLFKRSYADAPMRGEPMMVSHMMDLGPVYDQLADGKVLLEFETGQIRRAEAQQNRPDSNLLYFVAYNPYRDHWKGGQRRDALRIVKTAVEQHGAWGVKVYPPSGYRAAGNSPLHRPRAWLTRFPGLQWDARYGGLGQDAGTKLDCRLEELLHWCIEKDVPVFVHSGTGEFEARKGYGVEHSNPKFWREFLEKNSKPGAPCRLRLCLGHAGGDSFWFGGEKHREWGREAYDLCREFPNVYCEITTHSALTEPGKQAYFVDQLARLFCEPAGKTVEGHLFQYRYPFADKLIYGTDWYLPDGAERLDVLVATQRAFLHEALRPHYRDYFYGNALRFLDVRSRLRDTTRPLPQSVRRRLEQIDSDVE